MASRPGVFMAKVSGGPELARLFAELPKSLTDSVLRETAKKALQPVLDDAKTTVARESLDQGDLLNSLAIVTKLKGSQKEFSARKRGDVVVYAGATGRKGAHAHLIEFGHLLVRAGKTIGSVRAYPFLRPAWDAHKQQVLDTMRTEVWNTLLKAVRRLRKRAESGKLSGSQRKFFTR